MPVPLPAATEPVVIEIGPTVLTAEIPVPPLAVMLLPSPPIVSVPVEFAMLIALPIDGLTTTPVARLSVCVPVPLRLTPTNPDTDTPVARLTVWLAFE